jgi:hypothetical protein
MAVNRHGLSIGIERVNSEFFLTLKAVGTLQHSDYEVIVPMIDSALAGVKDAKAKVFLMVPRWTDGCYEPPGMI